MHNQILFIDLETTLNGKLKDIGALFNGQEFHGNDLKKVKEYISSSEYICGHNIINHDLPILKERLGQEVFNECLIIDTLFWSPLIFANNLIINLLKVIRSLMKKNIQIHYQTVN